MDIKRPLACLLFVVPGVITACQLISGLGDVQIVSDGADAEADAPQGCDRIESPARPSPQPGQVDGDIDFTVAVYTLDLGESHVGADASTPPPGLDLDRYCTGERFGPFDEGPSCTYPVWATADHTDDARGIDNAAARVFAYVNSKFQSGIFSSDYYSTKAKSGHATILLRVRRYNGEANDDSVELALYTSPGLAGSSDAGPVGPPMWDGSDAFAVNAGSTQGDDKDNPAYVDANAYVTDHILVANVPDSVIGFSAATDTINLRLTGSALRAEIVTDGGLWKLRNGQLAARWRLSDVFNMLSSFSFTSLYKLCNDGGSFYDALKAELCAYADIRADVTGTSAPCDAISFGMTFEADPAQLGAVVQVTDAPNACPQGQDPALDSCDTLP